MDPDYYQIIKDQYARSRGDSTELFRTILAAALIIGMQPALGCLEACVVEKRTAWFERNRPSIEPSGDVLRDAFKLFYDGYLGLSIPRDGEIIEANQRWITARWWNPCPTLEACRKFGLDTREICFKVYDRPVQALLALIDPRLRFRRNYQALRPYYGYCEESIELDET